MPRPRERVHRLERIVEELAAVVDPREPRTPQQLGAQHRAPELLDGSDFGEEAVAADVEAEALVFDRAGEAADLVVLFEDERADAAPREHPGRREAGGAGAGDDGLFSFLVRHALQFRPSRGETRIVARDSRPGRMQRQEDQPRTTRTTRN